jgi:hypothetical protein
VDAALPPGFPLLADRVGLWPTWFEHPIEQLAGQRGFPLLGLIALRPKAIAERPFKAGKDIFGVGLIIVSRRPFPLQALGPLDLQQVLVTLRWCG